ncbi:unnamed protein product [Amoebophrya sp. A120]|nr:unnamed protein product [Amoebophrya sp. A120]|eukprot:GSA120T00018426001.1
MRRIEKAISTEFGKPVCSFWFLPRSIHKQYRHLSYDRLKEDEARNIKGQHQKPTTVELGFKFETMASTTIRLTVPEHDEHRFSSTFAGKFGLQTGDSIVGLMIPPGSQQTPGTLDLAAPFSKFRLLTNVSQIINAVQNKGIPSRTEFLVRKDPKRAGKMTTRSFDESSILFEPRRPELRYGVENAFRGRDEAAAVSTKDGETQAVLTWTSYVFEKLETAPRRLRGILPDHALPDSAHWLSSRAFLLLVSFWKRRAVHIRSRYYRRNSVRVLEREIEKVRDLLKIFRPKCVLVWQYFHEEYERSGEAWGSFSENTAPREKHERKAYLGLKKQHREGEQMRQKFLLKEETRKRQEQFEKQKEDEERKKRFAKARAKLKGTDKVVHREFNQKEEEIYMYGGLDGFGDMEKALKMVMLERSYFSKAEAAVLQQIGDRRTDMEKALVLTTEFGKGLENLTDMQRAFFAANQKAQNIKEVDMYEGDHLASFVGGVSSPSASEEQVQDEDVLDATSSDSEGLAGGLNDLDSPRSSGRTGAREVDLASPVVPVASAPQTPLRNPREGPPLIATPADRAASSNNSSTSKDSIIFGGVTPPASAARSRRSRSLGRSSGGYVGAVSPIIAAQENDFAKGTMLPDAEGKNCANAVHPSRGEPNPNASEKTQLRPQFLFFDDTTADAQNAQQPDGQILATEAAGTNGVDQPQGPPSPTAEPNPASPQQQPPGEHAEQQAANGGATVTDHDGEVAALEQEEAEQIEQQGQKKTRPPKELPVTCDKQRPNIVTSITVPAHNVMHLDGNGATLRTAIPVHIDLESALEKRMRFELENLRDRLKKGLDRHKMRLTKGPRERKINWNLPDEPESYSESSVDEDFFATKPPSSGAKDKEKKKKKSSSSADKEDKKAKDKERGRKEPVKKEKGDQLFRKDSKGNTVPVTDAEHLEDKANVFRLRDGVYVDPGVDILNPMTFFDRLPFAPNDDEATDDLALLHSFGKRLYKDFSKGEDTMNASLRKSNRIMKEEKKQQKKILEQDKRGGKSKDARGGSTEPDVDNSAGE